jgi:hypothetical protein
MAAWKLAIELLLDVYQPCVDMNKLILQRITKSKKSAVDIPEWSVFRRHLAGSIAQKLHVLLQNGSDSSVVSRRHAPSSIQFYRFLTI